MDRTLADKGDLTAPTDFTFNFSSFDRTFESYYGNNIKLRYFIRVTIDRAGLSSNIVRLPALPAVHFCNTLSRYVTRTCRRCRRVLFE